MSEKTLVIIDSHALIYRAYYAFPPTLTTSNGEVINAAYGFTSLLLDVINKFRPSNLVAVLDSGKPVERQAAFTQYKANRDGTDDLLIQQIPRIEEILTTLNIPIYKIDGIEADDIIATIDNQFAETFDKTVIVTGDQDLFQLVDKDTFVYLAGRRFSESKLFDEDMVFDKLGITPLQVPDYKALAGDASDNIPGVKGIGPKTACNLIINHSTLEDIYENLSELRPNVRNKLVENQEIAYLSKSLATVDKQVPVVIDINHSKFGNFDFDSVRALFEMLQFRTLSKKFDFIAKYYSAEQYGQSLFDQDILSQEELIPTRAWDGADIDGEYVYFLSEFMDVDNPLKVSISRFVFAIESDVFVVELSHLEDFLKKVRDKQLFTFSLKEFWHALANMGVNVSGLDVFDLGISAVLLSGGRCVYSLNSIFHFYSIKYSTDYLSNVSKLAGLAESLQLRTDELPLLKELINIERQVQDIVLRMERCGIVLDKSYFQELKIILEDLRASLQKDIFENVGHEFNISSPSQVGEVLFVEKSLPIFKKTKGGKWSTDERSLRSLVGLDPVVDKILVFREVEKVLSTYIKSLPGYVNGYTGRVHASFDQFGAVSGRFSSKNPNMQNIPKGEVVGLNIRDGFVASEGCELVSFDYSQQELRILAALSGEETMQDAFNNDLDIHRITAAELFGISVEDVTDKQREQGKTINFSIIYGISAFGLADRMKISREEATLFIKKYFDRYNKVKGFMDSVLEGARENLFAETVMGRRRYSQTIKSNNRNLRSAAERELFNLVIQGSAADIMKLCMVSFDGIMSKFPVKLIAQIHDEFLFEFDRSNSTDSDFNNFVLAVKDSMLSVYDLGVKYKVDVRVGKKWGSLEKFC